MPEMSRRERRFTNGRGEGVDGDGYAGRNLTSWTHRDAMPGRQDGGAAQPVGPPSIYLEDPDVTIWNADVLDALRELPDESVHMACTSPPFYGLRDYGTGVWQAGDPECDHKPDSRAYGTGRNGNAYGTPPGANHARKAFGPECGKCGARRVDQQIGLEATPDEWVARLVEVFREVRRVLRRDGSLWVEIGDSYAASAKGSGGVGKGTLNCGPELNAVSTERQMLADPLRYDLAAAGVKPKDLIGAPWLLAFALREDGWYLRSEIIWAKPNPMPESVSDRPTTSHSRVFLLTKSPRYFYDSEAIREPHVRLWDPEAPNGSFTKAGVPRAEDASGRIPNPAGRNRRSVWTIATQPYPEAHFATWPEKLVEPMILAGTSERGVCPACGAPWERITESELVKSPVHGSGSTVRSRSADDPNGWAGEAYPRLNRQTTTTGWQPTCKCVAPFGDPVYDPIPATVLDPFGGSGTTALVARKHGRRAVLIELNPDYCQLAARRLSQQSLFA